MNIVIDNNGFVLYATPFEVTLGELSTNIPLPTNLKKPKFVNGGWIEGSTPQELADLKAKKTAELRKEYHDKIDALVNEAVQKKIIDGTEIPKEILDKREALRIEYHQKVALL